MSVYVEKGRNSIEFAITDFLNLLRTQSKEKLKKFS